MSAIGTQINPKRALTHGIRAADIRYNCWINAKERCFNKNHPKYKDYGARGITMYAPWVSSFEAFCEGVGDRPSLEHTLDRINVNGNYEPGNVRWATLIQQQRNTRQNRYIEHNGQTKTLAEWAEITGLLAGTIVARLDECKMTVEEALYPGKYMAGKKVRTKVIPDDTSLQP